MKWTFRALGLILALIPGLAAAQTFPRVPDHSVIGRIGIGGQSGPSQAIPFSYLTGLLLSALSTPNGVAVTNSLGVLGIVGTLPAANMPAPTASTLGGIESITCATNTWINSISTAGVPGCVQLLFSNLGGTTNAVSNSNLAQGGAATIKGNPTGSLANDQDFTIQGLTARGAPDATNDKILIYDNAAGTFKYVTPGQVATAATSGVSSFGGQTGALAASPANHSVVVDVGGTFTWKAVPDCQDSTGNHINYTQSSDAFSCGTTATSTSSVDNLLSNAQFQQWTGLVPTVKQNSTGTAAQTPASCTGFTASSANPEFLCANTQQIKVGDLVVVATGASFTTAAYDGFWGFSGTGYISCNAGTVQCQPTAGTSTSCTVNTNSCYLMAARVTAVVSNVSITVTGYIGGISPASSSAVYLYPIVRGDNGTSGLGPDGWTKTGTLTIAPDDFAANAYPGAIRTLVMRKGITGIESLCWQAPVNQIARYQGQTLSFGFAVNQTVQGGTGTWNISIIDSVGTTTSSNGTGSGAGGYQFEGVTRTISQTTTSLSLCLNDTGNSSDVLYAALPTAGFVTSILQSQLHANSNERIKSNGHCNPPVLTPWRIEFVGTSVLAAGLYGWQGIDLEAISFGCYHKSLGGVWAKIEYTSTSVTSQILTGSNINQLNFGPQAVTAVTGITAIGGPSLLELYHDGTFLIMSNTGTYAPSALTFDFWSGETAQPSSIN